MFRQLSVGRFLIICLIQAICIFGLVRSGRAETPNFATGLGWRGYAMTDLKAADFANGDFTIAARFMSQYPIAYAGPIVYVGNNVLIIAKETGKSALVAEIGGKLFHFPPASFGQRPRDWHHIAAARKGGEWTFYLDGQRLCPEPASNPCTIKGGPSSPDGNLRLGRLPTGVTFDGHEGQFYGLIDDVAVFRRPLQASEIAALANAPRLTGQEKDLFAGFTFDPSLPGAAVPTPLNRAVNFVNLVKGHVEPHPAARAVRVSDTRDSKADGARLDALLPPVQQTPLQLPFPLGESWTVVQGWQGQLSHNGRAAFALDFSIASTAPREGTRLTLGKAVFAAAPGKVTETRNDRNSCQGWPANYVMVDHAPEEVGAYLHFVKGSVAVKAGDETKPGMRLALAGDTGNSGCGAFHLHFSLHNKPESQAGSLVTIPAAFSNYLASDDKGQTWRKVARGVPRPGQWLRRCPQPGEHLAAGKTAPAGC